MNASIQIQGGASSRVRAAEAALMRWYPATSLGAIRAMREELPGWPLVQPSTKGKAHGNA